MNRVQADIPAATISEGGPPGGALAGGVVGSGKLLTGGQRSGGWRVSLPPWWCPLV